MKHKLYKCPNCGEKFLLNIILETYDADWLYRDGQLCPNCYFYISLNDSSQRGVL